MAGSTVRYVELLTAFASAGSICHRTYQAYWNVTFIKQSVQQKLSLHDLTFFMFIVFLDMIYGGCNTPFVSL